MPPCKKKLCQLIDHITVIVSPTYVESARDDLRLGVGDRALGSRNVEAERALNELGSRSSGGADGESTDESGGDEVERRHC